MGLIFESTYWDLLAVTVTLVLGIITYLKWCFNYWERNNIPYNISDSLFFNKIGCAEQLKAQYKKFKAQQHKHLGMFVLMNPVYIPLDLEIIKNMLTKDFHHFMNRGMYCNEKSDPLSCQLFSLEGAKWKNLRNKITPTFTSGKMRTMLPSLIKIGDQLKEAIEKEILQTEPINTKALLAEYTTDVIGSCAFGLDCNSFNNPDSEFLKYAKRTIRPSTLLMIKNFFVASFPKIGKFLNVSLTPKDISDFFMGVTRETINYRKTNNITRNDFMQLLMNLQDESTNDGEKSDQEHLTLEEIAAQLFIFFVAGYESSSSTMTFALYELAVNQEMQEKVRNEVNNVSKKHGGEITYEALKELKYMEQIIDETLRKYPPFPLLFRKCNEDYLIPGTEITLKNGVGVMIPVIGLHYDENYFPEPEKFDPERFSEDNKGKIKPFSYLPFGEGPRICIGLRFGKMQTKTGLCILLKNFKFSLNSKTVSPLKLDPKSFNLAALGNVWLNVEKI